ncbi:MAG: ThuA domain-containing protein [Bacteroidota bacterium]
MMDLKRLFLLFTVSILLLNCTQRPEHILIFSKTSAFRHHSIEKGVEVVQQMLAAKNIVTTTTEDATYFNEDSLVQYSAIIFLNTTGDVLNSAQQADFERYIQAGGGFVGIHAATDTEYHWPWYKQLAGAYFAGHPAIQEANLRCISPADPCCQAIPETWSFRDEWYNFRAINPNIEVLMELDESSYEGGKNGESYPIVWKHQYDGGRSFYTGMGHLEATFEDPLFQQQLWAGINYAIGDNQRNYAKARTLRVPEENRFTKQVLDFNLDEPMEMDELGEQGILFIERRGKVKLYDYATKQTKVIDTIDVHYANEDGLLGMAVDPNYLQNHWVYFFYSPNIKEPTQYISRFTLRDNRLSDEKVLLKIPLLRECCHSGGSLEFGKDGLLYIGVGDNTNPFESAGYAPIDERANRQLYDAQRSASNTNDLRGKILRIKPEADGTYSIPPGNLFPEGKNNCRPEIYVMGCRNPFRFSIDSKTQHLYWGDVGPDAGIGDSLRGPLGMGEFNQAREAGYYGWPYSRGNNQMYVDYDFSRKQSAKIFDPSKIVNNSPNNTGLQKLPPIQASMIWYSYKGSDDFPWLGKGGVNPMSGPIFHVEDYQNPDPLLAAYFDGKWLVYEWMRDWIYVLHLDEQQQFVQADPFMPNTEFSHPIDMLFNREGKLYVLEYGQKWNSRNLDARLSEIQFNNGNRPPIAQFEADKTVGSAPLKVHFSAAKSLDHDKDELQYHWFFEEEMVETSDPKIEYVFKIPGMYDVRLKVIDEKGEASTINKKILVGNEPPRIKIHLSSENRTYWNNKEVDYRIEVLDLEDGSSADNAIDPKKVKVSFDYIPEGEDLILASIGHQQNAIPEGLKLINASDCKACHAKDKKVAGPSYQEVAKRYTQADKQNIIGRIIKGSQGIWGETMMAPHPQLKIKEVGAIVDYILSLNPDKQLAEKRLPLEGKLKFDAHLQDEVTGKYVLMVSYLDEGHPEIAESSLSAIEEVIFIAPRIEMEDAVELDKTMGIWQSQGRTLVGSIQDGKHIQMESVSFDKLSSISVGAAFSKGYPYAGTVEVYKGSPNGELLGTKEVGYYNEDKEGFRAFEIPLTASSGLDQLFLVFINEQDPDQYLMNGDWIQLNYEQ